MNAEEMETKSIASKIAQEYENVGKIFVNLRQN